MKLLPQDSTRFLVATCAAVALLILAAVGMSYADRELYAQGLSNRDLTGGLCWIPGVGCGGGTLATSGLGSTNYEKPYYGGSTRVEFRYGGYRTYPGVTAYCVVDGTRDMVMDGNGRNVMWFGPVTGPQSHSIICYNFWQTGVTWASGSFSIDSYPPPVTTLTAEPTTLYYDGVNPVSTTLTWSATNEEACRLSGPNLNSQGKIDRPGADCATPNTQTVSFNSFGTSIYNLLYSTGKGTWVTNTSYDCGGYEYLLKYGWSIEMIRNAYGAECREVYSTSFSPNEDNWVVDKSVTIRVLPQAENMSITADGAQNSITLPFGTTSTIEWSAENVKPGSCAVTNNRDNTRWTGESGSEQAPPLSQSRLYTLNCKKTDNTNATPKQVLINLQPALAPTCTISADPLAILQGRSTALSYVAIGAATSATIAGNPPPSPGSVTLPSGTRSVSPQQTTQYTMTVTGPGGTGTCSTSVAVASGPPTLSISASPVNVRKGERTALTWEASGIISCSVYENSTVFSSETVGTNVQRNVNQKTTYTLSCSDGTNTYTKSVTVSIQPSTIEI